MTQRLLKYVYFFFCPVKSIPQTQCNDSNCSLLGPTAITETQKAALQVTYPRSQDLPLPSSYLRIHLSQWPSPSFLQVRVKEVAVGSVNRCSGLQTVSFPSLPPRFPCVPSIQWMLGKRSRSTQTLSWKADDPLWSKDWPFTPLSASWSWSFAAKLFGGRGSSYSYLQTGRGKTAFQLCKFPG